MSESIIDKVINHYVAKYILIPKLSKYLCKEITATRKGIGLTYAIKLLLFDIEKLKHKGKNIYVFKIDIKKYFYSIQNYKHSYSFVNKDKLKYIINRYY